MRDLQINGRESQRDDLWSKRIGPEVEFEDKAKKEVQEENNATAEHGSGDAKGEIYVCLCLPV